MAQNEFTKENKNTGIHSQAIFDAGLNVFALDLMIESFTKVAGKDTSPLKFTYKGVNVKFQINDKAL